MPRKPNIPCVTCGKLLWPTYKSKEKSAGQMCHPCRRSTIVHGTVHSYDRKRCRCVECRAVKVARVQNISREVREFVYQRDAGICQLCNEGVDQSLPADHGMSATVDHIECVSWVLVPDNRPDNLRLAHRSCNSRRRDRVA